MKKNWEESVNATITKTNDLLAATELLLGKGNQSKVPPAAVVPVTPPTARSAARDMHSDGKALVEPPTPTRLKSLDSTLTDIKLNSTTSMIRAGGPGGGYGFLSTSTVLSPIPGFNEPLPGLLPPPPPPRLNESISSLLDVNCSVFSKVLLSETHMLQLSEKQLDSKVDAMFFIHTQLARNGILLETSSIPLRLFYWNHDQSLWVEVESSPYTQLRSERKYKFLFCSGVHPHEDINIILTRTISVEPTQTVEDETESTIDATHVKLLSMASAVYSRQQYIEEMEEYLLSCDIQLPDQVASQRVVIRNKKLLKSALVVLQEEQLRYSPKKVTSFLRVGPGRYEEKELSVSCINLKYELNIFDMFLPESNYSIPFGSINRFSPYTESNIPPIRLGCSISISTDSTTLIMILPSKEDVVSWIYWVGISFEGQISVAP